MSVTVLNHPGHLKAEGLSWCYWTRKNKSILSGLDIDKVLVFVGLDYSATKWYLQGTSFEDLEPGTAFH